MPLEIIETLPSRPGIPSFPGDRANCPREGAFLRSPLAEFGCGTCSFARHTEGCCVGKAWHRRVVAGVWWRSGERVLREAY